MLRKRGELLVLTKQSVGYLYPKGASRSKLVLAKQSVYKWVFVRASRSKTYGSAVDDVTKPKCVKTSTGERVCLMKTIKEELSDLQNRVSFNRKRLMLLRSQKITNQWRSQGGAQGAGAPPSALDTRGLC